MNSKTLFTWLCKLFQAFWSFSAVKFAIAFFIPDFKALPNSSFIDAAAIPTASSTMKITINRTANCEL